MSKSRRIFLQEAALIAGALGLGPAAWARFTRSANSSTKVHPFDISTPEATTPAMVST
ncbi:MAG: twin-arginine translocation signal domain-containing protein [Flavobacteriales bacterium]|nr:twin-arginine translocation signal domain-containing protein [Flavobacteriales bacterium]